jgi:hypothetical protein
MIARPALRSDVVSWTARTACALAIASGALGGVAARALPPEDEEPELEAFEAAPAPPYAPVPAVDDHDPRQAVHPLRLVAYALHPVGVTLDYLLVRPAVWVVRHEPFRTFFGYQD